MTRVSATRTLENVLRRLGFNRVCGVDEVGRGCLAGPVVAGAVVLHPDRHIARLSDSKTVPPAEREELFEQITARALAWSVAEASPGEIDTINIHQASLQAMRRAVMSLAPLPDLVPNSRSADGATRGRSRRPTVLGDCGCVDRGKGDARPPDAAITCTRRALRIRSAQRLCNRRSSRSCPAVRLLDRAPAFVQSAGAAVGI
jgi:hypothetical protein